MNPVNFLLARVPCQRFPGFGSVLFGGQRVGKPPSMLNPAAPTAPPAMVIINFRLSISRFMNGSSLCLQQVHTFLKKQLPIIIAFLS